MDELATSTDTVDVTAPGSVDDLIPQAERSGVRHGYVIPSNHPSDAPQLNLSCRVPLLEKRDHARVALAGGEPDARLGYIRGTDG